MMKTKFDEQLEEMHVENGKPVRAGDHTFFQSASGR